LKIDNLRSKLNLVLIQKLRNINTANCRPWAHHIVGANASHFALHANALGHVFENKIVGCGVRAIFPRLVIARAVFDAKGCGFWRTFPRQSYSTIFILIFNNQVEWSGLLKRLLLFIVIKILKSKTYKILRKGSQIHL
jgi:hypothetical protein